MLEDLTKLARYLSLHADASADEVEAALRDGSSSLSLLHGKLQSRLCEMYRPAPLGADDQDYQEVVRRVEWWHLQTLEAFRTGDLSTAEAIAEYAVDHSRDFLGENHPAHRTALQNWGWILSEGGYHDRAEESLLRGRELARNPDGTPASDRGLFEEALGLLRHRQGRYLEAVAHYESAVALVQAGDARSTVIRCARGLGRALLLAGNPAGAQAVFEKLTELVREEAFPSLELASLLSERGSVVAELGRYEDAEHLMRQSLATYAALPTPEPIGEATTLSNLARLLEFRAKLVDALQVREKLEQILAPTHPGYVAIQNEWVHYLFETEQLLAIARLLRDLMRRSRNQFGKEHANHADVLENVGRLFVKQEKWRPALRAFQRVESIRLKCLGVDSPHYAQAMAELGYVLGELGQFDEAMTRLIEGHAKLCRTLGERHEGVVEAKANLGTILFRQGNFAEAEKLYIQSLLVWQELLGRSHPQTLVGLLRLSVASAMLGRVSEAIPLCATAAEGLAAHHGPAHGRTLIARANLGALVMDGGDLEGARPTLEQVESALASRADLLPHRVRNLNNLGCLYFRQGRYADATGMLQRARLIGARAFGTESDMMATLQYNEGACLEAMGDAAAAESLYQHASAMLGRVLGSNHPFTRVAQESLAELPNRLARRSPTTQARTIAVFLAV